MEWPTVNLGEVCDLQNGFAFKSKSFKESGTPVLRISSIQGEVVIDNRPVYVDEDDYSENLSKYHVSQGDLLIAMSGGTTGKIGFLKTNTRYLLNQRVGLFRPTKKLNKQYLFYFLLTKSEESLKISAGSAQPNLSTKQIKEFQIPLPSVEEQKRIVAILDEAFTGIDTAIANTEKNLANARELFESYLNSVFSKRGDGWVEKKLSEFCVSLSTGPFGSLLHKSDYVSKGVPLVNPINIQNENIVPDENKLIDESTKQRLERYVLEEGVVIARRGEIGRCAAIDKAHAGWVCGTGCFFIRPKAELNPKFLANLIRSSSYRQQLEAVSTGATMKNLSNKALGNLLVTIPDVNEQESILNRMDDLNIEVGRLELIYRQKLNSLKELKQSLLQKAFSGELTVEDNVLKEEAVA